ncbi:hypothetical protein [Limnoglobus roseus]|uniref:Uncharacterized protein n=1 Tax=Limnoglobus roseus TaxID=2598579 RepID=A0A5C1AK71_9BACT|nr:hypothetical protein [Limnoglobus roseus]QEL17544.1 hypothetical protein PX52LOC_04534 [Limnoglobus roseus]
MLKPNWFDEAFCETMDKATAEGVLREVAESPRIIAALKEALAEHDKHAGQHGWAGPSRTQVVRRALAEVLDSEN